jgi:CubicO group peptidase (beta-lactamase class C family)
MIAGMTHVLDDQLLSDLAGSLAGPGEPGLAIGVYLDGQLAASAAAGCAIVEHDVPVTERTAFDIASVSKHTTAACLLLLARDGLVDLDADVRDLLPELSLAQPITLRQCLTHTAGLRDYFALCDLAGLPVMGITEDRFTDLVAGQRDLDFAPGSAFSYSNTGYALASVVVRRLTGKSLAAFARERVFGPLGMTATHFRDDVSALVPRLAGGYLAAPDGAGFTRCDATEEVVGDGAVVTTVADLAGWHAFMASGAVLGTDIRDGLLARQVLTDGTRIGYALGLEAIDVAGTAAWWHSGSWAGYRAAVIYLPGQRAGVSVLANRNDRYASHVALAVALALGGGDARAHYASLCGIPADSPRPDALAGLWHDPELDAFLQLEAHGEQLTIREFGEHSRFVLGTDGWWHGTGTTAAGRYALRDGTLAESWGLWTEQEGSYHRVEPISGIPAAVPVGLFHNKELRAYADLSSTDSGAIIVIGLAAPRTLERCGDRVWRSTGSGDSNSYGSAGPLTVRLAPGGSALLVSLQGARHVRFDRVDAPPADLALPRGLSGAK